MLKRKYYYGVRFTANVVEQAHDTFLSVLDPQQAVRPCYVLSVSQGDELWELDCREEFLAQCDAAATYHLDHMAQGNRLIVDYENGKMYISVAFPGRQDVEAVFRVFERNLDVSKMIVPIDPVRVFIGHGHDEQWRDLKDHLHDNHGFDVEAYEIGPRAGRSVKDVLEEMLDKSSFALLVLTGEDQHADGELHARENVIHELGLSRADSGSRRQSCCWSKKSRSSRIYWELTKFDSGRDGSERHSEMFLPRSNGTSQSSFRNLVVLHPHRRYRKTPLVFPWQGRCIRNPANIQHPDEPACGRHSTGSALGSASRVGTAISEKWAVISNGTNIEHLPHSTGSRLQAGQHRTSNISRILRDPVCKRDNIERLPPLRVWAGEDTGAPRGHPVSVAGIRSLFPLSVEVFLR